MVQSDWASIQHFRLFFLTPQILNANLRAGIFFVQSFFIFLILRYLVSTVCPLYKFVVSLDDHVVYNAQNECSARPYLIAYNAQYKAKKTLQSTDDKIKSPSNYVQWEKDN